MHENNDALMKFKEKDYKIFLIKVQRVSTFLISFLSAHYDIKMF